MLIGMPVSEFNENKGLEVIAFRRSILLVCRRVVEHRESGGLHTRALYAYSPELEASSQLPQHLIHKLKMISQGKLYPLFFPQICCAKI